MGASDLYKDVLMAHYRKPYNYGDLSDVDVVRRGSNPRCGDEVEIGVRFDGERLAKVAFKGRCCAICIASASMMTEVLTGRQRDDARRLCLEMTAWFSGADDGAVAVPPEPLPALSAVRPYPARRRCVLLAWEALDGALASR